MKTAVFLLMLPAVWSQPLRVYSEFAQIAASGNVTAPADPREILSPAIARNAFSSFQIVVDVPRGTPFQLYVAQNPENSVEVTLYRESGEKLEKVQQPVTGNGTQIFWMDLWTARDAQVARIKVEPQLHVNNDWVIYPMEARVVSATVSEGKRPEGYDDPVTVMQEFLCGPTTQNYDYLSDYRRVQFRNAQQDIALAGPGSKGEIQKLFSACGAPRSPDPEWYLLIRDYLLRLPQTVR